MVIPKLNLVKGETSDEADAAENVDSPSVDQNHITRLLKSLVDPQAVKVERVEADDSYFAYVESETLLEEMVLVFIGVINQSSRQYSM